MKESDDGKLKQMPTGGLCLFTLDKLKVLFCALGYFCYPTESHQDPPKLLTKLLYTSCTIVVVLLVYTSD